MALGSIVGHKAGTLPFLGTCTDCLINPKGGQLNPVSSHSDVTGLRRPQCTVSRQVCHGTADMC